MADPIGGQLNRVLRDEDRYLARVCRGGNHLLRPLRDKLEEKIPEGLSATLGKAFYKSFELVLERGDGLIRKTCHPDRLREEYEYHHLRVSRAPTTARLRAAGRRAGQSASARSGAAAVEGGVLGLLGIGLPDIPLFIGTLLGAIYEIALSYGFDVQTQQERRYLLRLIAAALAPAETLHKASRELDMLARQMAAGEAPLVTMEQELRGAADALAADLLLAKFVQGLPLVGMVGGAFNYTYCRKITRYAALKYQKRYLLAALAQQRRTNGAGLPPGGIE